MLRLVASVLLLVTLAGCGGGGSDAAPAPAAGALTVSGQVTFDKVPAVAGRGLVYTQTVAAPARGVTVELLEGGTVRASTTTDAAGNYSFGNVAQSTDVSVRVRAEMLRVGSPSWDFRVVDNVNGDALYTLAGAVFNTGTTNVTRNLHAASGWSGSAYTQTRSAAPFAILDVAYDAVQLVVGAASATAFPALRFHWSPSNVPVTGSAPGEIGTSRFLSNAGIFLLGAANNDTDEYDRHVVAHEFGHYLEYHFSRLDSVGGPHALTDQLDIRLAFSEAWSSAFAAMVTGQRVYTDTNGDAQAQSGSFDLEQNRLLRNNPNPGWFNEESLQSLIFDLYDDGPDVPPGTTTVDDLALGFAPIWNALTGEVRTTRALNSVFPLIRALKTARPGDVSLIDSLTTSQRIAAVIDDFGTGQTNFGVPTQRMAFQVSQDFNTVYDSTTVGTTLQEVCSLTDYTSSLTGAENKLASRRFVRFTVTNPGQHTIAVRARAPLNAPADPDLILHSAGHMRVSEGDKASTCTIATPAACVEQFSEILQVGEHVLEVYEWTNTNAVDDPDPEHRPIGRTCFDVTVTR